MGKKSGIKKKNAGVTTVDLVSNENKVRVNSPKAYDKDTEVFISMSRELRDEGNKLFQKRDYEGAMLKYGKAIKLLPQNHIDVSYLRSNMAACFMEMGLSEYPRAIHECNLALEVTPKYSKALLKRARCYEALNKLDFASRDVNTVLKMEPNNVMATEIAERVRVSIEKRGIQVNEIPIYTVPEIVEPPSSSSLVKDVKQKKKKKSKKSVENKVEGELVEELRAKDNIDLPNSNNMYSGIRGKENMDLPKDNDMYKVTKGKENIDLAKGDPSYKGIKGKENLDVSKGEEEKEMRKKKSKKLIEKKVEDEFVEKLKRKDKIDLAKDNDTSNGTKGKENIDLIKDDDTCKGIKGGNKMENKIEDKKAEDKLVVEEKVSNFEEEPRRNVKLVFGDDIRWAQLPFNCSILKLREAIRDRFPNSRAVLVKYRDQEGDLVTITTSEELRWAEASGEQGSVRIYVFEATPEQDPFYDKFADNCTSSKGKDTVRSPPCIDDWIIQFAQLFKEYVGFNSDAYLDLHELGMKSYTEAMEDTVTSEEAQGLFNSAAEKFQEMAALALFNCGNVHMSKARKRVYFPEDASRGSVLTQVEAAYEWAQNEYVHAGKRYEEALKIKPDLYEAVVALGKQQFEQANLSWYYAIGTNVNLETWPSTEEVLQLYNNAEDNMERGMQMWVEAEDKRVNEITKPNRVKHLIQKMGLNGLYSKDVSVEEAAEQAANTKAQMHVLWGTMLYERSIMEFKLGLPIWQECLEVALEKFELAGASSTDIAVMIKNHCSNDTAHEGLGFNIDEIIQAWHEMYEAKKWTSNIPSFRLEPLLRRRVSKLYHVLENP